MSNPLIAGTTLGNFLPTQISGLNVWIDASQSGSFTITGGTSNLATITDLAENVAYTIGGTPTWSSTAFTSANGLTYPAFNMTNGRLIRALTNTCTTFQHTAFIVGRRNVLTGDGWPAMALATATGGSVQFFRVLDNRDPSVTPNFRAVAFGTVVSQTSNTNTTQPFLYVNTFNGAATLSSYMFHSGQYIPFIPSGANPAFTAGSNGNAVMIGTDGNTGNTTGNFWPGTLCEVIMYRNTVLSAPDRERVEGYLSTKWGLVGNLPIGHPYRDIPLISTLPPTGFDPRSIPNMSLWLDAQDTTTITGNPVTTWRDKSGAGFNATSATGPTQSTYNGYPVLSFNGTNQRMTSSHTINPANHTLITVYRPAVLNGNFQGNTSLFRYQTGGTFVVFPYMQATTQRGYITSYDGAPLTDANSTMVGNAVTTALNIIVIPIASGSQQVYLNGTLQTQNTQALTAGTSPTLTIGSQGGVSEFFQGDVGEMMVYSRQLTSGERVNITGYLAWKWGLQSIAGSTYTPWGTNDIRNFTFLPTLPALTYNANIEQAPAFNPRSISGMTLWLSGKDPNGTGVLPANGASISTWVDKSGSGRNATQASAGLQPTYNLAGQYLLFDGTKRFDMADAFNMLNTTNRRYTLFVVEKRIPGQIVQSFLIGGNTAGASIFFGYNTDTVFRHTTSSIVDTDYTVGAITNPEPTRIWGGAYSGAIRNIALNGSIVATTLFSQNITAWSPAYIGYVNISSLNKFYFGEIYEILFYNSFLNETQRITIEGYLAWNWGLQGNLPNGHPFKTYPPPP